MSTIVDSMTLRKGDMDEKATDTTLLRCHLAENDIIHNVDSGGGTGMVGVAKRQAGTGLGKSGLDTGNNKNNGLLNRPSQLPH